MPLRAASVSHGAPVVEATLWCMCHVELRVCFRCGRLGHLVKLCPSLAALTQSSSSVAHCSVRGATLGCMS
jgi:hypothetical protein